MNNKRLFVFLSATAILIAVFIFVPEYKVGVMIAYGCFLVVFVVWACLELGARRRCIDGRNC